MKWLLWKEGLLTHQYPVCARAHTPPTQHSAASDCSWQAFIRCQVLPQLELGMHSLCILLSKGAWPHTQHLPSSLASSLWYFNLGFFFPWVNILCRSCWHLLWSKFPCCFVEESGIFLYSASFKIKDGLSGLAGLQQRLKLMPGPSSCKSPVLQCSAQVCFSEGGLCWHSLKFQSSEIPLGEPCAEPQLWFLLQPPKHPRAVGCMKPDLQKVKLFAEIIPCQMVLLRKTF